MINHLNVGKKLYNEDLSKKNLNKIQEDMKVIKLKFPSKNNFTICGI